MDRTGLNNIVLIGMPASGKTAIGRRLSKKVGLPFFDGDIIFEERYGKIRDFFQKHGELEFRQRESEIINEIAAHTHCIIATGGGTVLRGENMIALKQHGLIVWLKRDYDRIKISDDRPLLKDKENWLRLQEVRQALYRHYSDVEVDNNGTFRQAIEEVKRIMEAYGLI